MDLIPILHLSPAKEMKCSYLYYVQLLMIGLAGWWTRTPFTTPPKPKQWNALFCIMFNIWWLARLVNGLEPHPPPLSQPIKWNAHFWITFNFWWSAGLVGGLKPHSPPLSSQKNEMLIFGLRSTSDDQPGLVNGLKPHLPSLSSQKNEMLLFVLHSTSDVGQTGQWTQTPSTSPLQPKKWNASFYGLHSTSDDWPGWWWTQTSSATPLQPKKMKCSFLDYVHFWWSARLIDELEPHLPPFSYQKNEMLNFRLHSTSDDQPSWSIDSKSICQPSPANKMKCSFFDPVQLLMISWAGQWT